MQKTLHQVLLIMPASQKDYSLRDTLFSNGYELLNAPSLISAIQKITEYEPDLVICHHKIGDHTGFEIFKSLQALLSIKEIPFMIYLDNFDKNEVMIGLEMGIDNFIIKPFDKNSLIAKIRKYTKKVSQVNVINTERFNFYFNKSPYAKFITENKRLINYNEQ